MAVGGRGPRRRSSIRPRRRGSKLGARSGDNGDLVLKPGNRSCGEWICVRGHRITPWGRMRVDANGNIYVPNSEEEEPGMEVAACGVEVADSGAATVAADGVEMAVVGVPANAVAVGADRVTGAGVDVAAQRTPADAIEVAAEGDDADGVKVAAYVASGDKMHPKVVARLNMLLADIDPTFHDIFVNMYKVMVPAFFDP